MKKYLLNIGVVLFDRISMLIFQIWMASYYVRTIGIDNYGQWSYTLNIITIIVSLFILGIDVIIIKDIVNDVKKAGRYIFTGILIQLTGFILVCLLSLIILDYNNSIIRNAMLSILGANFFIILSKIFYWNYSALVESKYRTISVIISFIVFIPLVIFYLNYIDNKEYILYIYLLYYTVQFIISLFVYLFLFKSSSKFEIDSNKFKDYTKIGIALIVSTLSTMLFTQTDVLMIKYFLGNTDTGEFSAAVRLSTSVFILAGIIANTFYPKIINFSESDKLKFIKVMISTMTILTLIGSFITMIIAPKLTLLLYGTNENIGLILSWHIWCSIFIFTGAFTSRYLYSNEMYKIEIIKTLIAAIINIMLNVYLIPKYGVIGAVVSSFVSYLIANYVALSLFIESRHLFYIQTKAFLTILRPQKYWTELKSLKCLFQ